MPHDHQGWIISCDKHKNINWKVVELLAENWLELIQKEPFDLLLLRPPGRSSFYKQIYDDRIEHLSVLYSDKMYPSLKQVKIYENKRYFSDWLMINKIPHPKTSIFYTKVEAVNFLNFHQKFPLVSKLNIGASGKGVTILKTKEQALDEVNLLFGEGKKIIGAPNIRKGSFIKKLKKLVNNPKFLNDRMKEYKQQSNEVHKNYVIFQEFINHSFEWRCVVIGNSYFAHKKLGKSGKTSGSLLKDYSNPPLSLLNFVRELSINHKIDSAAIDIFEHNGKYLVNEIQCFFGQSDPHQMFVNDKPGRYFFDENIWVFEEGTFNDNQCFDLRLKHALELCKAH
jgi:glutathione synthase/RimK-type ligase-like ATP-grasp enzyme